MSLPQGQEVLEPIPPEGAPSLDESPPRQHARHLCERPCRRGRQQIAPPPPDHCRGQSFVHTCTVLRSPSRTARRLPSPREAPARCFTTAAGTYRARQPASCARQLRSASS